MTPHFANEIRLSMAAFRYSQSVLKIYGARYVCYRFSILAINIETQPILKFKYSSYQKLVV